MASLWSPRRKSRRPLLSMSPFKIPKAKSEHDPSDASFIVARSFTEERNRRERKIQFDDQILPRNTNKAPLYPIIAHAYSSLGAHSTTSCGLTDTPECSLACLICQFLHRCLQMRRLIVEQTMFCARGC